jgi:hypothetical protein
MTKPMPGAAGHLAEEYPYDWKAYAALGKATAGRGPLTARENQLLKLARSIGQAQTARCTPASESPRT